MCSPPCRPLINLENPDGIDTGQTVDLPGQPTYHYLPANADTVHWGYFSKLLKPQLELDSGDYVTIEALTHHANDDAEPSVA
jgi:hypothetical protein